MNPLTDKEFLKQLYSQKVQQTYVKIIAYDLVGRPVETLSGKVQSGNINLDGKSSVRRTCSLTLQVQKSDNFHDYYWVLTTNFQLLVGLKNNVDLRYENIIWFPMGYYLISQFSYTTSDNFYTIQLQGKDKMCKLNGEFGGTFNNLSTLLSEKDILNSKGNIERTEQLSIKQIIENIVCNYGQEEKYNIVIENLDIQGKELLEYNGDVPMYLLRNEKGIIDKYIIDETYLVQLKENGPWYNIGDHNNIIYERINDLLNTAPATWVLIQDENTGNKIPYQIILSDKQKIFVFME